MIVGVGVDLVDIARFTARIDAQPRLLDRLFTARERALRLSNASFAARFAAKEALIKALGGSTLAEGSAVETSIRWHDLEVLRGGRPQFSPSDGLLRAFALTGVERAHLSLSHDGGIATAYVVLEGAGRTI